MKHITKRRDFIADSRASMANNGDRTYVVLPRSANSGGAVPPPVSFPAKNEKFSAKTDK